MSDLEKAGKSKATGVLPPTVNEGLEGLSEQVERVKETAAALRAAGVSPSPLAIVAGGGSAAATAVADQIIHRAAAAMADVHAHAMSRVTSMRMQLDELERTIAAAKENSERHMKKFMTLCAEGEESIRSMEEAVHRISDHLYTSSTG